MPTCMNQNCPNHGTVYARGLCELCYRALQRMIRLGRITIGAAEKRGLCLPKSSGSKRFPLR